LHFTNQNTTTISFTVYHCIAYYRKPLRYFLAQLHLHIYFQFCILTHTLCLTTTWWGWGYKANLFTLQVVWRGTGRVLVHTVPWEFDIKPWVTFMGENCASLCSSVYSWSLNLAEASSIFSGAIAEELVEGSSQKSLHHQLVQTPKLGEVAPMWVSSCPFRFAKYFIFILLLSYISFLFQFCIYFTFLVCIFIFSFAFCLLLFVSVALVVVSFYFQFSF
jgi:hypothetical protein